MTRSSSLATVQWLRTLLLFSLVVACTKTETIRSEPAAPMPPATVRAPNDTAFPRLEALPPEFQIVFAPLGTPCASASSDDCGTDGRVARVVGTMGFQSLPQGLYTLRRPDSQDLREPMLAVGIERERIWMLSGCRICRINSNAITVVVLSTVKDEARMQLQQALQLPETPLLRTPEAFREALLAAGFLVSKG